MNEVNEIIIDVAIIEIIEIIHFNKIWQSYTKAYDNCHISLILVEGTTRFNVSSWYVL
jgi:hypothetical protein